MSSSHRRTSSHGQQGQSSSSHSSSHSRPSSTSSNKWAVAAARAAESSHGGHTYDRYASQEEEDNWNNSEWLQEQTRQVQGESLSSTRRALSRLNEAQSTAEYNLNKLSQQSEQLYNVEKKLDSTESHAQISSAKADRLKSLNRFFMLPAFGAKAAKLKEERLTKLKEQEFQDRKIKKREDEWTARNQRMEQMQRQMNGDQDCRSSSHDSSSSGRRYEPLYTTPNGIDRDETEVELDSNMNEISSGLSRLKMMGMAMNEEISHQSSQLGRIQDRTDSSRDHIGRLNAKMDAISSSTRRRK